MSVSKKIMNKIFQPEKRKVLGEDSAQKKNRPGYFFRINFLFFLIFAFSGLVALRVYFLQVLNHEYYQDLADNQHSILQNLIPQRGEIFLKEGDELYPLAVNKVVKKAYAVPREMSEPDETAIILSEILELDEDDLRRRFSKRDDMYEPLRNNLPEDKVEKLDSLKLKGVHLADESLRYYPAKELASQVIGFQGWSGDDFGGRYGVERYYNSELSGQAGQIAKTKDGAGLWVPITSQAVKSARNGDSFVLSIDHIIQYEAEKMLRSAVEKYEAERGTVIVMEPFTGRILAMAGYPGFDPNQYQKEDMQNFRNLAVSDPYECGSVFKTITLASAIDAGKIRPDSTYVDTGAVTEAGFTIRNSDLKAYGLQTMSRVLEESLNTGVIYAEKLLGNENFSDYVKRFGFGSPTGIDLPGESAGNISNLKNVKRDINFFTATFGQGISVTPIQLISAYNAIASNGMLMKPKIAEKIIRSDGTQEEIPPEEVRKVISQQTAVEMAEMLRGVVVDGHGKPANVPGYLIGGKTGTAQVASSDSRGYEEGKNIGSFVGFFPTDNPAFTVLVRIDDPKTVEWAESSAAPLFGELAKFLLDYKNIQPTEDYTQADLNRFNVTHKLNEYFLTQEDDKEIKDEENEKNKSEE